MELHIEIEACPLCKLHNIKKFYQGKRRTYLYCQNCGLVFVPSSYFLSEEDEKARYNQHCNSPEDTGYRQFLSRIFNPLQKLLPKGSHGLDFGSGTGPTLSRMLEEAGHTVDIYDYYFANNISVFDKRYDFITTTEVVEHLKDPHMELNRLWDCVKDGGRLGIMTKLVLNYDAFTRWHYKTDPTHISFYSRETFTWLAGVWGAGVDFVDTDVILFHKQTG